MGVWSTIESVARDAHLALRLLVKYPGFSATVLGTTVLGIACTTAIFTFVDVILLRALPVSQPQQLVAVGEPGKNLDLNPSYYSQPFYRYLRDANPIFTDLAATSIAVSAGVNLDQGESATRIRVELVSGNYFHVLGIQPVMGRFFGPAEDVDPDASPVAVMSYSFWQRHFAGSPGIVGETVTLNGNPFTIVGVTNSQFFGTRPGFGPDLWAPLMMVGTLGSSRIRPHDPNQNYVELFARLREGTSLDEAQTVANVVYSQWVNSRKGAQRGGHAAAPPTALALTPMPRGLSLLRGQYSRPLGILMSAVMLFLIIACANVPTLLLSRAVSRAREVAIRRSIGASRSRIVGQMITESVVISLLGGGLGWAASLYLGRTLLAFLPNNAEPLQFSPNATVFVFAMFVAVANGILFGIAPAIMAAKKNLVSAVKEDLSALGGRGRRLKFRDGLTAVQIALSLMLVIGAGLFLRTLQNLRAADMGFRQSNLLLVSLDPARSGYQGERVSTFFDAVQRAVREQPGVVETGLASFGSLSGVLPVGTRFMNTAMRPEGHEPSEGEDLTTYLNTVTPGYFSAVGLPVLQGRSFGPEDRQEGTTAVIINQAAAQYWFPGENPVGKRIGYAARPTDLQVVGIVPNAKYQSVRESTLRIVYFPLKGPSSPMTLHVRTDSNAETVLPYIHQAVQSVDPHVPLFNVQTVEARIDESLKQERLVSTLASWLGIFGSILAAIGLYGMISYSVAQSTREIGIRMALGATRGHVLAIFVRRALTVTVGGTVIGLTLSLLAARAFSGFLYELSPADPATLMVATGLLLLTAVAAAAVPAFRAARIDPLTTLRHE